MIQVIFLITYQVTIWFNNWRDILNTPSKFPYRNRVIFMGDHIPIRPDGRWLLGRQNSIWSLWDVKITLVLLPLTQPEIYSWALELLVDGIKIKKNFLFFRVYLGLSENFRNPKFRLNFICWLWIILFLVMTEDDTRQDEFLNVWTNITD